MDDDSNQLSVEMNRRRRVVKSTRRAAVLASTATGSRSGRGGLVAATEMGEDGASAAVPCRRWADSVAVAGSQFQCALEPAFFQTGLHGLQESTGIGAVNNPVIVGQ